MTYESQSLPAPGSVPTRDTAFWKRLGVRWRIKRELASLGYHVGGGEGHIVNPHILEV